MATGDASLFGILLRRYRLAEGWTQEELAERARLSVRAISDLERGLYRSPRKETVRLLADALQLAPPERNALETSARRRSLPHAPSSPLASPRPRGATSIPLIGRSSELALLERHLTGAGPPVLLLAGEPGIGKSRLLGEAARRAAAQGWTTLAGGCQRRGGQEPYAPLLQALAWHISRQHPAERRAALQGCGWIVRLLPELVGLVPEPMPAWTLPPEQERRLMFAAVARFLANVAGPAGTLLVLDDLQWAGADALALLAALVRAGDASAVPVQVIGAYRDTEARPDDALAVLLADLAHAGQAAHHTLAPLAQDEVKELLGELLRERPGDTVAVRDRVLRRSGGVPFFVVSCARALTAGSLDGDRADAVPWDVAQSVRQRVAGLSDVAREVLGAAALIGRVVGPALLLAVAGHPTPAVLAALDAACRSRLLVEVVETGDYQFAHDVIREVVEADVGIARRALLHRRIAGGLEQAPGAVPVEALAYHYSRSETPDRAVPYLEQAGDRAGARHAHAAAEGYYREAADRLDEMGCVSDAARARVKLGTTLHAMARYEAALDVLERAAQTQHALEELDSLRRTMAQIGQVHAARGTPHEGIACLQPLLAEAPTSAAPTPSSGLAELHAALAHLFYESGHYRDQLQAAERASALARAVGDDRLLAEAEGRRGLALVNLERLEEGGQVIEEASRLSEAAGDLDSLCRALVHVGNVYLRLGRPAQGRPYFARALAAAERLEDPALIALVLHFHGWIDFCTGAWTASHLALERAVALGRQIGPAPAAARALFQLAELFLAQGDWDEAVGYVDEGLAMVAGSNNLPLMGWGQNTLARRDLLRGDARAACMRLAAVIDHPDLNEQDVNALLPTLAEAYLAQGDVDQAHVIIVRALARSRARNDRVDLVDALRVQAMIASAQDHWEEARAAVEEALGLARTIPIPYAEGGLVRLSGMIHLRQGETEAARACLAAALAVFQRLGARTEADRTAQLLREV